MKNALPDKKSFFEIFPEASKEGELDVFLENVKVAAVNVYARTGRIEVNIESGKLIPANILSIAQEKLYQLFNTNSVNLKIKYDLQMPLEEILALYWDSIIYTVHKNVALSRGILNDCSFLLSDKKLVLKLRTHGADVLRSQSCDKLMENMLEDMFSYKIRVEFVDGDINEELRREYLEFKANEEALAAVKANEQQNAGAVADRNNHKPDISYPADRSNSGGKKSYSGKKSPKSIPYSKKQDMDNSANVIAGKNFGDEITRMADVTQESGKVAICGEIFRLEFKELRGEKHLCTFDMTDYSSSLTVKLFAKIDKINELREVLKENMKVKVRGDAQYDKFTKELGILAKDIVASVKEIRTDAAENKRVELHLHTRMSSMDAVSAVQDIVKRASEWGHSAVAITDHGVVQAFPEAYEAAGKVRDTLKKDLKIIYGTECYLISDNGNAGDYKKAEVFHAIILVKNYAGLGNLYKIISKSHLDYFYKKPRVPKNLVMEYREGLILGTACEAGELYSALIDKKNEEEIEAIAGFYDYLEIQPLSNNQFLINNGKVRDREELKEINNQIVKLGEKLGKLVVATCDVHFLDPLDEVFRRVLMAGQGYADADRQAPLFFRTTGEMLDEFSYLGMGKAYEVVVENTNKIADLIEKVAPIPKGTFAPRIEGSEDELRRLAEDKAREIYGDPLPRVVEERLAKELNSIIKNGFAVMYSIARKLVTKSLEDGYLVGSRGSVGSSFVANLVGITEVNSLEPHYICTACKYSEFILDGSLECGFDLPDKACPVCGTPLKKDGYDIPFETFLGFEGDKEPDIDLNFSGEYQARAHKYTEELFGAGNVFRAGTIATVADKTAYGFIMKYLNERGLMATNAEINRLVKGCSGVKRTTGQHPGGVMIVPDDKDIHEFCPIQHPADDSESNTITTHFDYHSLSGRLLKLDILGHDDPTVIKMLEDLTGVDARSIVPGEAHTMGIFRGVEPLGIKTEDINSEVGTFAVPEFGTKFVRQMLMDTRPKTFAELIRISGLSHGTDVWLNNAQEIIRSKTATLSEAICCRDDIMLYLIHKGLPPKTAFKIMEDVRKGKGLKEEYVAAMQENDVPEWYIASCKKIKYMFPKAHAAAYVMMAFRIAWFKVNYPEAFYIAYFTVRADEFDADIVCHGQEKIRNKIAELEQKGNAASAKEKNVLTILEVANEMYARGIKFENVDLYKSDPVKFLKTSGGILPPLIALQGLGGSAAQNIAEARLKGSFISIDDLRVRAKISKAVIEILQQHGCLDGIPESSQMGLF